MLDCLTGDVANSTISYKHGQYTFVHRLCYYWLPTFKYSHQVIVLNYPFWALCSFLFTSVTWYLWPSINFLMFANDSQCLKDVHGDSHCALLQQTWTLRMAGLLLGLLILIPLHVCT